MIAMFEVDMYMIIGFLLIIPIILLEILRLYDGYYGNIHESIP